MSVDQQPDQQMAAGGPVEEFQHQIGKFTLMKNIFSNKNTFKAKFLSKCTSGEINNTNEHNYKLFVSIDDFESFAQFQGQVVCGILGGIDNGQLRTARVCIACMPHNQLEDGHILNFQFTNPEDASPLSMQFEMSEDAEVKVMIFAKLREVKWGEQLPRGALIDRMAADRTTLNMAYEAFNRVQQNAGDIEGDSDSDDDDM